MKLPTHHSWVLLVPCPSHHLLPPRAHTHLRVIKLGHTVRNHPELQGWLSQAGEWEPPRQPQPPERHSTAALGVLSPGSVHTSTQGVFLTAHLRHAIHIWQGQWPFMLAAPSVPFLSRNAALRFPHPYTPSPLLLQGGNLAQKSTQGSQLQLAIWHDCCLQIMFTSVDNQVDYLQESSSQWEERRRGKYHIHVLAWKRPRTSAIRPCWQ